MKNPSLQKLIEDVYKVAATGQAGTETDVFYDVESKDAALTAAQDGLDVPKENIKSIEKIEPSEATDMILGSDKHAEQNKKFDKRDNRDLHENGDMLAYFAENYGKWFKGLKKRYKNKEISKNDAIAEIKSKTKGKPSDERTLLKSMGFHKAAEGVKCASLVEMKNSSLQKLIEEYNEENNETEVDKPEFQETETGHTTTDDLNILINDELEAIEGYNNMISKLALRDCPHKDKMTEVLQHIKEEELHHIEELKELLALKKDGIDIQEAKRTAPHVIDGKYIRLDNGQVIEPDKDYFDDDNDTSTETLNIKNKK